MEKAVAIVLTIINCVVAIAVFSLILTERKSEDTPSRTCTITYNGTDVDVGCFCLYLGSVPKSLPINTTRIDLRRNGLSQITNNSFGCLGQLQTLDLRNNGIHFVEGGSFHCLSQLSVLHLSNNLLNFSYESLPIGLFSELKHLKELDMHDNLENLISYPEMTFLDLTNLESLTLPVLHFGISFSKMIHLKELILFVKGYSRLSLDTFAVFSGHDIHTLTIHNYAKKIADTISLKYFHKLHTLTLENVHLCLRSTLESLKAFSGMNMSLISLLGDRFTFDAQCNKVLTPDDTKHLVSICVEKVDLIFYGIKIIQKGTFNQEPFSKCIKYLNLNFNCIMANKELYLELQGLLNLEYLSMKMKLCLNTINVKSEYNCTSSGCMLSELSMSSDRNVCAWSEAARLNVVCGGEILHVSVPKKIKTLIVPNLFQHISLERCTIKINGAENLEHLDVSNWNLNLRQSKILGVTNLKYFDYTGNYYQCYEHFLFNGSTNVNRLILDSLSRESLFVPYFHIYFVTFRKLKYLSVRNNGMEYFPFEPEELSNLSAIDLSHNKINTLSSDVREGLDQLVKEGKELSLNLQENLFNCACTSLNFVLWVIETDVRFTSLKSYKCINEGGEVVNMPVSAALYLKHWRKCYSRYWLAYTVSIRFLFITVLVIGVLLDKNSLRLKCILLKWFGLRFQVPKREDFLYDIFVYYSPNDDHTSVYNTFRQKMEKERGLRLCIPDRDFVPGSCTAEEILEAIHDSWKTVVYMTEVFLEDELCTFTLHSAVYASTNEMPNRLILLYSNEIFNKPLPPIVIQLLDGDDNFMLEELEKPEQWDILYRKTLCWV